MIFLFSILKSKYWRCVKEGKNESESVVALSNNMLRPVSFGLLFCIYTGAMVCVCVHVSKDAGRKTK